MVDDLPLLPNIPDRLRLAARQGTLIPFVGAGVSRLGGCPSWDQFADGALSFFVAKGLLSHGQYSQLSKLNPRVRLSIAQGLEEQHQVAIDFKSLLTPSEGSAKKAGEQIYRQLARLASTFITTNYDEWLDVPQPAAEPATAAVTKSTLKAPRVYFRPEDFTATNLNIPNAVFHIHGSVRDRETMVFTTAQYLERYAGHSVDGEQLRENPYLTFLDFLFRTKNVLFIGYGLAELEILEYVIQKARAVRRAKLQGSAVQPEPRHYLLEGFFSHELDVMRSLRSYYARECDIGLLPFSKETQGHNQLIEVVTHLSREIPAGGVLAQQEFLEMEELLK